MTVALVLISLFWLVAALVCLADAQPPSTVATRVLAMHEEVDVPALA